MPVTASAADTRIASLSTPTLGDEPRTVTVAGIFVTVAVATESAEAVS